MSPDSRTRRAGTPWAEADYRALVDQLRAGRPVDEIAVAIGRSAGAVRASFKFFLPLELHNRRIDREAWLRTQLASPKWDWLSVVVDNHRRIDGAQPLWTDRQTQLAAAAWERRTPIDDLADQLGCSEIDAAKLLMSLGKAADTAEIARELHARPGSVLDARRRMSEDRSACAVWVLVVDHATGGPTNRELGHPTRISIHADQHSARTRRDELVRHHDELAGHAATGLPATVRWSITQRTIGDDAGTEEHGLHQLVDTNSDVAVEARQLRRGDRIHPTAGSAVYTVDDVKPSGRRIVVSAHSEPETGITMRIEIDYLPTTLVQLELTTESVP